MTELLEGMMFISFSFLEEEKNLGNEERKKGTEENEAEREKERNKERRSKNTHCFHVFSHQSRFLSGQKK